MLTPASAFDADRRWLKRAFIVVIILVSILFLLAIGAPAFIRGLRSVIVVLQVENLRAPIEAEEEQCVGEKHNSEGVTRCSKADPSCQNARNDWTNSFANTQASVEVACCNIIQLWVVF